LIDDTTTTATNKVWSAKKSAEEVSQLTSALTEKYTKPSGGIPAEDLASGVIPSVPVTDVQVAGTSVLSQGVANVPIASKDSSTLGVVTLNPTYGLNINDSGRIYTQKPSDNQIRAGTADFLPIVPMVQHRSVFFGLAKAAGADMASLSSVTVGQYPEAQKKAIRKMLGIPNPYGELIKEVTLAEDATEAKIDTDSNGLPFKLSKMIVIIDAPASTTGTRDNMYANITGVTPSGVTAGTSTPSMQFTTATGPLFGKQVIIANPGMPIETYSSVGSSEGNSSNLIAMQKIVIYDYLVSWMIYQSGSTKSLVPAGTNIKLYGIRIDE
jgi:hypothetical protein